MACTISVHILPYHVIMVTKRIKEICELRRLPLLLALSVCASPKLSET